MSAGGGVGDTSVHHSPRNLDLPWGDNVYLERAGSFFKMVSFLEKCK